MLSRVAENLYWISRYVERAEGLARLLEDAHSMALEGGTDPLDHVLLMFHAAAAFERARAPKDVPDAANEPHNAVLSFLTFARTGGVSIREALARARENARGTQEWVTGEAWSQLNKLHLFLNGPRARAQFSASPARLLARVRRACVLFTALLDATMPRTEAYHFLQIGRHLERVDVLSRVINVHCSGREPVLAGAAPAEAADPGTHWTSLLRETSAHEAYLQHAQAQVEPVAVVRYLLLRTDCPRSMRFSVAKCLESLRCVAGGAEHAPVAERHLDKLDSDLRYVDVGELFRKDIREFLVSIQTTCAAVARDIDQTYFRT
jgi:uncharacterized alpha-E superfamily protein